MARVSFREANLFVDHTEFSIYTAKFNDCTPRIAIPHRSTPSRHRIHGPVQLGLCQKTWRSDGLRIEDTTKAARRKNLKMLFYLPLNGWVLVGMKVRTVEKFGPYRQSERLDLYKNIQKLVNAVMLILFCSADLNELRKKQIENKETLWRPLLNLSKDEVERKIDLRKICLSLKNTGWWRVSLRWIARWGKFEWRQIDHQIIQKSTV